MRSYHGRQIRFTGLRMFLVAAPAESSAIQEYSESSAGSLPTSRLETKPQLGSDPLGWKLAFYTNDLCASRFELPRTADNVGQQPLALLAALAMRLGSVKK
jgi:hypothetical protein